MNKQVGSPVGNAMARGSSNLETVLLTDDEHRDHEQLFGFEDSPSYEVLRSHNLMTTKYRVKSERDLDTIDANSNRTANCLSSTCCFFLSGWYLHNFEVPNGSVRLARDGRGGFAFFGAGVHSLLDMFYSFSETEAYASGVIVNGDRTIATVPQGYVGFCMEMGQPVLLPPGMHQWRSNTLRFERNIDLNDHVIPLGPWTLITIDEGYNAVTQDNGKQVILDGGHVHLLTHRNWKFEKFVSTKIQTNNLQRNEAASADNVIMLVDATVLWRVADVETAVRQSAETMSADGTAHPGDDIQKLRNDVLKQAEASLAMFIGTINFSDTFAAAASVQRRHHVPIAESKEVPVGVDGPPAANEADAELFNLYHNDQLSNAVGHANEVTRTYGVEIIAINIISAVPKDAALQESLAAGAVAAAEAQMMETTARGRALATEIDANAEAAQKLIVARADGEADVVRAQGSKQAADLLNTNDVAVQLALIEKTGTALDGNSSFFFGADQSRMGQILTNPALVPGAR